MNFEYESLCFDVYFSDAKFQCIRIKRRYTGVIEMHLGQYSVKSSC